MDESGQDQTSPQENQNIANRQFSKYLGMIREIIPRSRQANQNAKDKSHKTKNTPDEEIVRFTRQLSRWTLALVIVGGIGTAISALTLLVINGQLSEMRDEQRPWVYADVAVSGPLVYKAKGFTNPFGDVFEFVDDTSKALRPEVGFNGKPAISLELEFTPHNVGHTPALNTVIEQKLIVMGKIRVTASDNGTYSATFIDSTHCKYGHIPSVVGSTVFNGQEKIIIDHTAYGDVSGLTSSNSILLVVCISYVGADKSLWRTTSSVFVVDPTHLEPETSSVLAKAQSITLLPLPMFSHAD